MMYPFMTLDDDTEIVHSEMKPDGRVKVYLEKPDAEDCFHSAVCWLPGYDWQVYTASRRRRSRGIRRSWSPPRI